MIDSYLLASVIVIFVAIVSVIATVLIIFEIVTGSYKRYAEKRMEHLDQIFRVREELKRGKNHEH